MSSDSVNSVLRDVLRVYDQRFLDLDDPTRRRLVLGTRQVLGDGLSEDARNALPAAYRLRAFCIQRGLHAELERLIRDEVAGHREGAVVVGGRIYAVYPYLRGVPRQYADITSEVGVEHRLDAVAWSGRCLRVRGRAALQQVESRHTEVVFVLRDRMNGGERHFATERNAAPPHPGFEVLVDPADLAAGRWGAYIAVTTLGVTREAPLGGVRGPRLKVGPLKQGLARAGATARLTENDRLAVELRAAARGRRRRRLPRLRISR